MMNLRIDNSIAPIGGDSQMLLTHVTKEVAEDAACGGVWVNQTLRQLSQMGIYGSTPGDTGPDIR